MSTLVTYLNIYMNMKGTAQKTFLSENHKLLHTCLWSEDSGLCFPYAQFLCSSLSGDQLYPLVWDCVSHLEMIGFKVLAMTADGASCNRKFMSMLQQSGAKKSASSDGIVYQIDNIYAPDNRPIFLFSDVPHLIKTTRNCWSNSFAHRNSRKLWVSDSFIV